MSIKIPLDLMVTGIGLVIDALQWLWDMILQVGKAFDDVFGGIADTIGDVGGFFGDIGGSVGGLMGFAEGGLVPGSLGSPMPAIVHGGGRIFPPGEVIPVKVTGGRGIGTDESTGVSTNDTYNVTIQTGVLPETETPESIADKLSKALTDAKMRGATGG